MEFFEFVWEMLSDWPIGTILGGLMIVLVIVLLLAFFGLIFEFIDCSLGTTENGVGTVIGKHFEPEHTTYVPAGKGIIVPLTDDDEWTVEIEVNGKSGIKSVSKNFYERVQIHDRLNISYTWGKFTRDLYIQEIL